MILSETAQKPLFCRHLFISQGSKLIKGVNQQFYWHPKFLTVISIAINGYNPMHTHWEVSMTHSNNTLAISGDLDGGWRTRV